MTTTPAGPAPVNLGELFGGMTMETASTRYDGSGLTAIRAHDPALDPEVLIRQVCDTVRLLKRALTEQNPALERAVSGDALWQARLQQRANDQAHGWRRIVEGVRVDDCMIWGAQRSADHDSMCFLLTYQARAGIVDRRGSVVEGAPGVPRTLTEKWFLQRSATATTRPRGTLDLSCPGCGAECQVAEDGRCSRCRAAVSSGELDWVVVRIEAEGTFSPYVSPLAAALQRQKEIRKVMRRLRWRRLSDRLHGRVQPPRPPRRPPPVDPDR